MTFTRYMGALSVFLLVPFIIGWLVLYFALPDYYFRLYPLFLPYFLLLGSLFYMLIAKNAEISQRVFFAKFTGHTFLKLFISIIAIVLYGIFIKTNLVSFAVTYMVFYLVLSALEIRLFVKKTKKE